MTAAQFVKRNSSPVIVEAARYLYGQPLDDIRCVALRGSHAAQLIEVPAWRLLLVRTGPPESDPFYEVVADGTWLVYDWGRADNLAAWDDDEFAEAYRPAEDADAAVTVLVGEMAGQLAGELIVKAVEAIITDPTLGLTDEQQIAAANAVTRHMRDSQATGGD